MNEESRTNLTLVLSAVGAIFSIFIPVIGYLFLIPSLILSSKRENITILHTFVFDIVALASLTIILFISLFQTFYQF